MTRKWKTWIQIALLASMPSWAAAADTGLTGNWLRDNHTVRIAVSQCGGNFCAVNTWVKRADGSEKKGDKLIMMIKPVSGSEYDGTAYDVRRQRTYKITLTLQGNSLHVSGCVLLGVICKSVGYTRED